MNLLTAFALAFLVLSSPPTGERDSTLVAAPVPKADLLQEARQSFQGEWKIVEFTVEGKPEDKDVLKDSQFVIKGDKMEIRFRGTDESATFTLDPKADPPTIDIQPKGDSKLVKGLYRLEKDKITICFGLDDAERPKEFKSPAKSQNCLLVLERVKK